MIPIEKVRYKKSISSKKFSIWIIGLHISGLTCFCNPSNPRWNTSDEL